MEATPGKMLMRWELKVIRLDNKNFCVGYVLPIITRM